MFPLGDDFRFDKVQEWDQQYENYVPLMNYINSNWDRFRVHITFGTVSDYFRAFEAQRDSQPPLPTFSGDFFPYSDIYVAGRPAYWTGFYGTRPFWKKLYREAESALRGAEIAYTYAYNLCSQKIPQGRNCLTVSLRHSP
jgi:alpha-mannosidase II